MNALNAHCTKWNTLIAQPNMGWPGQPGSNDILLPNWQRLDPLPNCLSGFAPNRNHNADVFNALSHTLLLSHREEPVLAMFCVDPFLSAETALRKIEAHRSLRVINFPTISMLGAEFVNSAQDVGLGVEAEIAFLKQLQSRGRKIGFAATRTGDFEMWGDSSPDFWMVVPSFEYITNDRLYIEEQLSCARNLARNAFGIPVIIMSPAEAISAFAAEKSGASGLVIF